MADGIQTANNARSRLASAATVAQQPDQRRLALRMTAWLGLLAAGFAAVIAMASLAWDEAITLSSSEAGMAEPIDADWPGWNSPDHLELAAEASLQELVVDEEIAYFAARRVVEIDPSRASAWAMLAYLEYRRNGDAVSEAALDALSRSMDVCPLCDQALIRWRFNFVLANWDAMPEQLRRRAFEHADLLRWIGPHAEFLAEMRVKARQQGIPFDAYRAAVDTPARTWDIGPTSELRRTQTSAG